MGAENLLCLVFLRVRNWIVCSIIIRYAYDYWGEEKSPANRNCQIVKNDARIIAWNGSLYFYWRKRWCKFVMLHEKSKLNTRNASRATVRMPFTSSYVNFFVFVYRILEWRYAFRTYWEPSNDFYHISTSITVNPFSIRRLCWRCEAKILLSLKFVCLFK